MSKNIQLLLIDPQNDFASPNGSLFVPGSDQDMIKVGKLINRLSKKIDDIHVTLDSHRLLDIAHPLMHINSDGEHPSPFTIISSSDYDNGVWRCTNPNWQSRIVDYVHQLEVNGRYPLCIWPVHCRIAATTRLNDGSEFCGHAVVLPVSEALVKWEEDNFATVDYCVKGSNLFTENYSILKADVPDPSDPSTQLNTELLSVLQEADEIIIAGEALSHCVKSSIEDVANEFDDSSIKKFILLEDCCSNVPGFEGLGRDFVKDMKARGMRTTTSTDYLA